MDAPDEVQWDPCTDSQTIDDIAQVTVNDLLGWLNRHDGWITITYRLSSIGCTQNPVDVSHDYLEAILLGERLVPSCVEGSIASHVDWPMKTASFTMRVRSPESWAEELHWIAHGFAGEDPEAIEVGGELLDLSDAVYSGKTLFPELGDACLANLVNGYFSDYPEWHEELLARFPEWRYRYWKSCCSSVLGFEIFVSTTGWVLPPDADFARVVGVVSDQQVTASALEELRPVPIGEKRWIFCGGDAIHRVDPLIDPDTRAFIRSRYGKAPSPADATWTKVRGGDAVMARFKDFGLVTFWEASTRLRPKAVAEIRHSIAGHLEAITLASGPAELLEVDWSNCSPENFERICRELLCRSGKFDPDTVRSFGKVNSRDGGRDIEIHSKSRPGVPPAKWIFQCKRFTKGRSIAKADVSISDMIDEYGIEGFGIMTSGAIDATAWDRLDAIAKRRGIQIDCWDGQRVASTLQYHQDLLKALT